MIYCDISSSLPSSFSHTPLAYYFPTDNYRTDFAVKIAHASSSSARQSVWCPWFHLSQSLYEETEDMTSPRFSFPVISVISVFSCSVFLYLNWSRHYQNTTCYLHCSWGRQYLQEEQLGALSEPYQTQFMVMSTEAEQSEDTKWKTNLLGEEQSWAYKVLQTHGWSTFSPVIPWVIFSLQGSRTLCSRRDNILTLGCWKSLTCSVEAKNKRWNSVWEGC